jgi:hypothetical protein
MPRSVKEQIQSGLRLGAGLGVFLIGALLLGQARTRLEVLSSYRTVYVSLDRADAFIEGGTEI